MKIGSFRLNGVWFINCKTLNHPLETVIPTMTDTIEDINNLNLKGINFFSFLDDIHRLVVAKRKKIIAEIRNNLILEKRLIKKICENPKASNHKKLVYNPVKADIEKNTRIIIQISILESHFLSIIVGGWLLLLKLFIYAPCKIGYCTYYRKEHSTPEHKFKLAYFNDKGIMNSNKTLHRISFIRFFSNLLVFKWIYEF